MKKKNTNAVIKMLGITLIAVIAILQPAFSQKDGDTKNVTQKKDDKGKGSGCGSSENCFDVNIVPSSDKQVKLRLPLDIRSGDVITGSVIEEKKSATAVNNNSSSIIEGVVIEIDGKQTKLGDRLFKFLVPAGITSLPFLLKNSAGQVLEQGQIPINSYFDTRWQEPVGGLGYKFAPEALGQPGKTLRVTGSFDGNAANTNISLNGQACEIIAESPRQINFLVPENATTGSANLKVEENNIKEEHKVNIAKLNLSANKTTLRKGQKATITVTVSGLESLKDGYECKVDINNLTPEIVIFKNKPGNSIRQTIPSGLTGDYTFTLSIVGVTQGDYVVEGLLFCRPNPLKPLDEFGDDVFVEFNDDVLFDILRELNRAKDNDYTMSGGKPGPNAAWLWERIEVVMKQLRNLGWEPDPHDANYMVNKHSGERRSVR
jgi:hypothetical protein